MAERRLKDVSQLRIVSVAVVNETPGSRREVPVAQMGAEMERMRQRTRLKAAARALESAAARCSEAGLHDYARGLRRKAVRLDAEADAQ